MQPKFAHGDRVTVQDDHVASQLKTASRSGKIIQSDPETGVEGSYQVMFDGEDLPQWVTGASLKRS